MIVLFVDVYFFHFSNPILKNLGGYFHKLILGYWLRLEQYMPYSDSSEIKIEHVY